MALCDWWTRGLCTHMLVSQGMSFTDKQHTQAGCLFTSAQVFFFLLLSIWQQEAHALAEAKRSLPRQSRQTSKTICVLDMLLKLVKNI